MTFEQYLDLVTDAQGRYPNWRKGQTYFNVLWHVRPDLSEKIRGTELDPFHVDERIPQFLTFIGENW